jgi:ABC-type nickel/cobalt efflux system permease component RcnA
MDLSLPAVLALGFLLGLRHAFEPDHLAAVSTLATRAGRLRDAARLGAAWGLGHTASVAAVALLVVALGVHLGERVATAAELLVALLLVGLGGSVLWRYARGRWHMHFHEHGGASHLHLHSHAHAVEHAHAHPAGDARRSLGLGLAHGMAGSGAVLVLVVAATPTAALQLTYVGAFGIGTIAGMLTVSLGLGMLVRAASRGSERLATLLHLSAATASVVAGLFLARKTLGS